MILRNFSSICISLACFLNSGLPVQSLLAAEPMPGNFVPPEQRNAAIRYLIAVTMISSELGEKIGLIDWKAIGTNVDPSKMPASFNEVAKTPMARVVEAITEGSRMSRCNFENNYEAGVGTLVLHLGQMRQLARILRFDSRLLQTQGKADAAADRLLTMLRLAVHIGKDGWFINILVDAAIQELAFSEMRVLADAPTLSAAKRTELIEALQRLSRNYSLAIETERRSIISSLEKDVDKPDGGAIIAALIDDKPASARIAGMSKEQLREQVALLGPMYDLVAIALKSETSDEEAAKTEGRIKSGEFGLIGANFMPGIMSLRKPEQRYKADIAQTIAILKGEKPAHPLSEPAKPE